MNNLKQLLAGVCYYSGDFLSKILDNSFLYWLYPVYNKLMGWSVKWDVDNKYWEESIDITPKQE